jgi:hypothetical protein
MKSSNTNMLHQLVVAKTIIDKQDVTMHVCAQMK